MCFLDFKLLTLSIFNQSYIRYAVRQKRADTKRALKDLLFKSGSSKVQVHFFCPECLMKYHIIITCHKQSKIYAHVCVCKGCMQFTSYL